MTRSTGKQPYPLPHAQYFGNSDFARVGGIVIIRDPGPRMCQTSLGSFVTELPPPMALFLLASDVDIFLRRGCRTWAGGHVYTFQPLS